MEDPRFTREPSRSNLGSVVPDEPFRRWPYTPRPIAPQNYVGPQWAAPAPYPVWVQPRRRSSSSGCLALAIGCFVASAAVIVGVALVGVIAALILFGATDVEQPPIAGGRERPGEPAEPSVRMPAGRRDVPEVDLNRVGTCSAWSEERDTDQYSAYRNGGAARRLRGRVAVLHLRVSTQDAAFSRTSSLKVEQGALAARSFYMAQAARFGVKDLEVDVIPWTLSAAASLPALTPFGPGRLDEFTRREIARQARHAIETSLDIPLERLVRNVRASGYDEVGMIVYFPARTSALPFAFWSAVTAGDDSPELGYVFAERESLPSLAVTAAHEGLHLFGASDLYRMRRNDPADRYDVMNDTCQGFRYTTVGDLTAYAVGWTNAVPARPYPIVLR